MKTSELIGPVLDWAVAKCEGATLYMVGEVLCIGWEYTFDVRLTNYSPSTDWAQGGPIIGRKGLTLRYMYGEGYDAYGHTGHKQRGSTPLIAAMRCYVASKFGDEIDVPEELLGPN